MKSVFVLAASVLALAFGVSPSAGGNSLAAACKPGLGKIGKTTVYRYCGPAKATVKIGGKTYSIVGGRCRKVPGAPYLAVDIGAKTLSGKSVTRYLVIRNPKLTDGVTRSASVNVQLVGATYVVGPVVVTVSAGRTRGTFAGDALGAAGRVTGSWTC
jgi:hypothetical protein